MRRTVLALILAVTLSGAEPPKAGSDPAASWTMAGHDLRNTRHQDAETIIGPSNVGTLKPKWVFATGGDLPATPAVVGGALYIPDMDGNLYRLDAATGHVVWSRRVIAYTGLSGVRVISRTTPAIWGDRLFIGTTHINPNPQAVAQLVAVSAATGDRIWSTVLETQRGAHVLQSPVVANGVVYVGVASNEESLAVDPRHPCCTFRGSVVAVDAVTGSIRWQTYLAPDNHGQPGGFSGIAVWGSTPVVDAVRNSLYVTTGNNYDVPQSVKDCEKARRQSSDPSGQPSCNDPGNHVDAVVALDLDTGQVKWARSMRGYDTHTFACLFIFDNHPNCAEPEGPDHDFGQGPMLFSASIGGTTRELVGAGQKSGVFWALDPDTGAVVWRTVVGPGGMLGGLQWGSATDGQRVYAAVANFERRTYRLTPSGKLANGGSWGALDMATGQILWQTADPMSSQFLQGVMAIATAPVTVANGVLYGGSMDRAGHMYAMDAKTGVILWTFASGGSVNSGPAVVDGVVYWGSGYGRMGLGSHNNKLYAFAPGTPLGAPAQTDRRPR